MGELVNNTQLELSAEDLRAMTKWPDALIEDYLAISRQLVQVTSETTIVIEQTAVSLSATELVSSRVKNLAQKLNSVAEMVSIIAERSGNIRFERQLPARIMARVVLGI